ncbi:RNA-directed DNA polymerase, eukaryota, partial [Tanacetum coccineum]
NFSDEEIEEEEIVEDEEVEKPICLRTSKSQVHGYLMRSFGKHWKEINVTWAQLEKKRDKDATLQDFDGALDLHLKQTLKTWIIQKKSIREHNHVVLQEYLLEIDSRLDKGEGLLGDLPHCAKTFHDIGIIDRKISVDMAQKAKKRRQQAIKGILVDGQWTDNLDHFKREFYNHFANRFSAPHWSRVPMEANRLSLVIDELISHEQSALIKGRQILDGLLILNEIVSWCKSMKEQALFKWRGWIRGFLHSLKASVLVNGSPTDEFLFHRRLRQGDPLSSFLFILVMESLYVAFQRVITKGMFVSILVGKNDLVHISYLFYADDAIFIDIQSMANSFGCLANNLPFTYLGVKVAANMTRSLPTYYMSLFKALDGVLSHLERLRNSFFLGAEMDERLWLSVFKGIHGSNGSLDQPPSTCTGCSIWITVHKAIASLKSKGVDLLGFYKKVIGNVAQKFQNPDIAVSFRRSHRGGIEESQF